MLSSGLSPLHADYLFEFLRQLYEVGAVGVHILQQGNRGLKSARVLQEDTQIMGVEGSEAGLDSAAQTQPRRYTTTLGCQRRGRAE